MGEDYLEIEIPRFACEFYFCFCIILALLLYIILLPLARWGLRKRRTARTQSGRREGGGAGGGPKQNQAGKTNRQNTIRQAGRGRGWGRALNRNRQAGRTA